MTVNSKVWEFPPLQIEAQLFHVVGSALVGGLTSGGANILSPEPSGRSKLETKISLQTNEWSSPYASWLMSKTNGEIFRVQLTKTPQLVSLNAYNPVQPDPILTVPWDNDQTWDNDQEWLADGSYLEVTENALEGDVALSVDTGAFGNVLKHGHVIGIGSTCYIIDDVDYEGMVANLHLKPSLRKNVPSGATVWLKPYFVGTIANGPEIKASYEANKLGAVQLETIVFNEVIL